MTNANESMDGYIAHRTTVANYYGSELTTVPSFEADVGVNITDKPALLETYPEGLIKYAAISGFLISAWGILANIITLIAIARSPNLRNATTAFILNLCFADTIFCIFSPSLQASTFLHRGWVHGEILCKMLPTVHYNNLSVSLFTVIAIAINRYILIAYPWLHLKVYTPRRIAYIIFAIWFVSFVLLFPPVAGIWGEIAYNPDSGSCTIVKDKHGRSPKHMLFILALVLPSVTFCICYMSIYMVVRKANRNLQGHAEPQTRKVFVTPSPEYSSDKTDTSVVPKPTPPASKKSTAISIEPSPDSEVQTRQRRKLSNEMRVLRMILVIFVTYVLCFYPLTLAKLVHKGDLPVLNVLGFITVNSNACVNPVIYVFMSKEYRRAYKNLLFCRAADSASSDSGDEKNSEIKRMR